MGIFLNKPMLLKQLATGLLFYTLRKQRIAFKLGTNKEAEVQQANTLE